MKRYLSRAFTMIELVLVIVVIGLLAALAIPRMERDIRQEAVANIVSALQYAKHMALIDDVSDPGDPNWQRGFWRFGFEGCSDNGLFYYVGADKDFQGDIDENETVPDPSNGLPMMGSNSDPCEHQINNHASPNIFVSKLYGIVDPGGVTFTNCGGAGARYVGFDHLGRPHGGFAGNSGSTSPDYSTVLSNDCIITLHFSDNDLDDLNITIEKRTGRIHYTLE